MLTKTKVKPESSQKRSFSDLTSIQSMPGEYTARVETQLSSELRKRRPSEELITELVPLAIRNRTNINAPLRDLCMDHLSSDEKESVHPSLLAASTSNTSMTDVTTDEAEVWNYSSDDMKDIQEQNKYSASTASPSNIFNDFYSNREAGKSGMNEDEDEISNLSLPFNALQQAAYIGHYPSIKILLDHRVDMNAVVESPGFEFSNLNAVEIAEQRGHHKSAKLMMDYLRKNEKESEDLLRSDIESEWDTASVGYHSDNLSTTTSVYPMSPVSSVAGSPLSSRANSPGMEKMQMADGDVLGHPQHHNNSSPRNRERGNSIDSVNSVTSRSSVASQTSVYSGSSGYNSTSSLNYGLSNNDNSNSNTNKNIVFGNNLGSVTSLGKSTPATGANAAYVQDWNMTGARLGVSTADGCKRPTEDRVVVCRLDTILKEEITLLCVCDGHGGRHYADTIAKQMQSAIVEKINALINSLRSNDMEEVSISPEDYAALLEELFLEIDTKLINSASKNAFLRTGGTTATVCLLTTSHIITANVGDSPCVVFDASSAAILRETLNHCPSNEQERERVLSKGGQIITSKENGELRVVTKRGHISLTRAFGQVDFKLNVDAEDRIVNACPQTYVWSREQLREECHSIPRIDTLSGDVIEETPRLYLALYSDSFTEALMDHPTRQIDDKAGRRPQIIGNSLENEAVMVLFSTVLTELGYNAQLSAQQLVEKQVKKFCFNGKYFGDNTSLILVDLHHELDNR